MLLTVAALGLSPGSKFGGDHEAHANAQIWQTLNTQAASAPEPYRPPVPMRRAMDRNWTVAAVPVAAEPEVPPEEEVSAPPSLNAALNQANEASAAAAMPVFPNVDLEVLEETQAEMDITRFVVLSQARSGSTWLVNMLNSHPNVLAFGEYLSSWAGNNVDGDGLVCKPQERLAKLDNINDWKQCSEWNFADKRKWLEAAKTGPVAMGLCVHTRPTGKRAYTHTHDLVAPCCSPRCAFALARVSKWFNNHGGWDLDWARHQKNCPTDGCQTCKEPSDFSSWIHDKNVKLILLERSASLPHFISEMKQHAFGTNRCTDPECAEKVAKQKVRVDLAQMHRWFNYTTDNWDMMKDFARRSSLERQFFTYDEMCDRPQARGATSNLRRAT
tara:strand:+ start:10 stop:1167 length:1158 start_codon:yes stop_codon:yes gene_type:complete